MNKLVKPLYLVEVLPVVFWGVDCAMVRVTLLWEGLEEETDSGPPRFLSLL